MILAHETWFEHGDYATDWGFAGEALTIALLAAALTLTVLVRLIARARPGVDVAFLGALAPWMPFALRMHLAVSLISLLSLGVYLSPAMDLDFDAVGVALGAVMVLTAVGMATGFQSKAAAWLLIAAGPIGMLEFGFWDVVQRIERCSRCSCTGRIPATARSSRPFGPGASEDSSARPLLHRAAYSRLDVTRVSTSRAQGTLRAIP